ncbi:GAF domain-containing protein [Rubinisphaera margarita]|uniref:GAF domain-containing protein n=1 Tax=Rubinisphaera margarita TaxID=2909586 RepID=UPI001EE7CC9A|nr:GAF domain-containing protein [Rubinisphaera margarita]MCG6157165.1 HlyD family efflux transporter periplasmic adaptor subunit [Rubinisphaera margarita]
MNEPTASERIAACVQNVEKLARQDLPREEFFRQFLQSVSQGCRAPAAAIWGVQQNGLNVIAEENLAATGAMNDQQIAQKNMKLLAEVVNNSQSVAIGASGTKSDLRPTPHLFVCSPIFENKKCVAVMQLFFPEKVSEDAQKGLLQFSEHLAGLASLHVSGKMTSPVTVNTKDFWESMDRFLLDLHNGLDTHQVASTAANDSRQLLAADRVAIAMKWGHKTRMMAVSGQDKVNRRSNLMQKLNRLTRTVYATGKPFIHTGELKELAPQVEKQLADYLEESNARMLAIYPLVHKDREHKAEDRPQDKKKPDLLIGAMVVELLTSNQWDPDRQAAAELMSDHIATAIHNADEHEKIFLLPVWRTIGRGFRALRGKTLAKTLVISGLVLAVVLALMLIKYPYRATGDGRLMPVVQRDVFAQLDAEVQEVLVRGGEPVKKGELLVQLTNPQLQSEFLRVQGEISEKSFLVRAQQAELEEVARAGREDEAVRLQGQIAETQIEVNSLKKELEILQDRISKLKVFSPIDGVIATFQVDQLLRNRPVRRGDVLMEVMDPKGAWHLELEVKDKRMGHMLRAQQERDPKLDVEYVLATDPETTYEGHLQKISTRTAVNQEAGNVVQVVASINEEELPELRIGAEVKAKIDCGRMTLGYVLFGDALDFIRIQLWL